MAKRSAAYSRYAARHPDRIKESSRAQVKKRAERRKSDPIYRARIVEEKRMRRQRLFAAGLTTRGTRRVVRAPGIKGRLWKLNAYQAWRHWLNVRAPNKWLRTYYRALGKPWLNPRLSSAKAALIRYYLDPQFPLW
jgi:hypothetical protein